MRVLIFILMMTNSTLVVGQEKEKWKRVYTYDDSVIEMNTTTVVFVDNNIARVIFRTVWSKQQNTREKPGVKYKSRREAIEYKCAERRYRIYQVTLLDSKGEPVDTYDMDQDEEWRATKSGGIMERLMAFGCGLAAEKKDTH